MTNSKLARQLLEIKTIYIRIILT